VQLRCCGCDAIISCTIYAATAPPARLRSISHRDLGLGNRDLYLPEILVVSSCLSELWIGDKSKIILLQFGVSEQPCLHQLFPRVDNTQTLGDESSCEDRLGCSGYTLQPSNVCNKADQSRVDFPLENSTLARMRISGVEMGG